MRRLIAASLFIGLAGGIAGSVYANHEPCHPEQPVSCRLATLGEFLGSGKLLVCTGPC